MIVEEMTLFGLMPEITNGDILREKSSKIIQMYFMFVCLYASTKYRTRCV